MLVTTQLAALLTLVSGIAATRCPAVEMSGFPGRNCSSTRKVHRHTLYANKCRHFNHKGTFLSFELFEHHWDKARGMGGLDCFVQLFDADHCKGRLLSQTKSVNQTVGTCQDAMFVDHNPPKSAKLVCKPKPKSDSTSHYAVSTTTQTQLQTVIINNNNNNCCPRANASHNCCSMTTSKSNSQSLTAASTTSSSKSSAIVQSTTSNSATPSSTSSQSSSKSTSLHTATIKITTTIIAPPTATVSGTTTVWVDPTTSSKKVRVQSYVVTFTDNPRAIDVKRAVEETGKMVKRSIEAAATPRQVVHA